MTRLSVVAALVVGVVLVTLAGCAQQTAKTAAPSTTAPAEAPPPAPPPPAAQAPPPAAEPPATATEPAAPPRLEDFADEPALKDVLFEHNRADIVRDGASVMMANARWLVARWLVDNREYSVLIEGHTDRRETREESQALAELRVRAVARFLVTMGVPETRLHTVSYGSERPVCRDASDACAARNRRVHFRVKRQ